MELPRSCYRRRSGPAVVLLDGAGIPGTESICAHGVTWYTHRLGGALLGRLSRDDGRDLGAILAATIGEVAAMHRGTCDVGHPSSPQATVAMVRARRGRLDYLLLADSFLVLDQPDGGPQVLTDEREANARRACSAPLAGVAEGTPEYDWPGVLDLLDADGPIDVIRRVRRAEARAAGGPDARVPDDATVAHCAHLPRSEVGEPRQPAAT
ncbi:hypothetical protein ABGB16_06310 [Micromonospora sp. B11E3]|uniref:hypothetical protein n=1 Tax=Micromonospora sp. B11E3 TaxID=3153562 RepID=UPI00325E575C